MESSDELKAAQIRAAADLTASALGHIAPKWEEGRVTVEGLATFAIDLYEDILRGIITKSECAFDPSVRGEEP